MRTQKSRTMRYGPSLHTNRQMQRSARCSKECEPFHPPEENYSAIPTVRSWVRLLAVIKRWCEAFLDIRSGVPSPDYFSIITHIASDFLKLDVSRHTRMRLSQRPKNGLSLQDTAIQGYGGIKFLLLPAASGRQRRTAQRLKDEQAVGGGTQPSTA